MKASSVGNKKGAKGKDWGSVANLIGKQKY